MESNIHNLLIEHRRKTGRTMQNRKKIIEIKINERHVVVN
jgi:hypothetical protein